MEKKYLIDSKENKEFMRKNALGLLEFGRQFPSPGGSSYYLDDSGNPMPDKPRETWITSRMAHVYSIGAMLGSDYYTALAGRAIGGLRGELKDAKNGGWFSGIRADGSILPDKMCYAHAFVMLAASSAMCAGIDGARELLDEAIAVFDKYFWDEDEGMTRDTWDTTFSKLDPYRGLNANMHTVEAYLAVADALERTDAAGDANDSGENAHGSMNTNASGEKASGSKSANAYRERAGRIIDRVIAWASENNYRIPEHYDENWNPQNDLNKDNPADPFKPYGVTPGHGIEWARLITQWAVATYKVKEPDVVNGTKMAEAEAGKTNAANGSEAGKTNAANGSENRKTNAENVDAIHIQQRKSKLFMGHYIDVACKLYGRAVDDAWCADGGEGLVYTTDLDGRPIIHDRMHWTLAEAINTSAVLYRMTGEDRYAFDFGTLLEYLDKHVMDHEKGSWFHQLDAQNNVLTTVWPGKPDVYHAFQAMMIPYLESGVSIASAVLDETKPQK